MDLKNPMDGSHRPDGAVTLLVAFDHWENGLAEGSVWSYGCHGPRTFCSLDQLVVAMEELMDQTGGPESWLRLRQWGDRETQTQEADSQTEERKTEEATVQEQAQFHPEEGLPTVRGRLCTASVRVRSRQHATMQGDLMADGKTVFFRSALELLFLLRQLLNDRAEAERERSDCDRPQDFSR